MAANQLAPLVVLLAAQEAIISPRAATRLARNASMGDASRAAQLLQSALATGAVLGAAAGPVVGAAADRCSQRATLLGCVVTVALARARLLLEPHGQDAVFLERAFGTAGLSLALTLLRANSLSSHSSSLTVSDSAISSARLAQYTALGLLVTPLLAARLSSRNAFRLSTLVLAAAAALVLHTAPDTPLRRDSGQPGEPVPPQRASAMGKATRALVVAYFCQSLCDATVLQDLVESLVRNRGGLARSVPASLALGSGIAALLSPLLAEQVVQALGPRGHLTMSNLAHACACVVWAASSGAGSSAVQRCITLGSFLTALGQRKHDISEVIIMSRLANERPDLGPGQVAMGLGFVRFVATLGGPILRETLVPAGPFIVLAGASLLAEGMLNSQSDEQLCLQSDPRQGWNSRVEAGAPDFDNNHHQVSGVGDGLNGVDSGATKKLSSTSHLRVNTAFEPSVVNSLRLPRFAPHIASRGAVFLDKTRKKVQLVQKLPTAQNGVLFRFALPDELARLGLPIGKHIKIHATDDKGAFERKFTPASLDTELGYVDVIVKLYAKCEAFPAGGRMSAVLDKLQVGDTVEISGPYGLFQYHNRGIISYKRCKGKFNRIGLLAGGSGITPMLQLIRAVLHDPFDTTQLSLLYANHCEEDIFVCELLDHFAALHPSRFRVHYTVSNATSRNWPFSRGRVSERLLRKWMPPNEAGALILMCGPPGFVEAACRANLKRMGYSRDVLIEF